MKVLICSDGSPQAENALRFTGMIAEAARAELTLLAITEKPGQEDAIFDSLRRGQQYFNERGLQAELITKAGEPIAEIVKRTRETHYDLVVIGAIRKGTRGPFLMSAKAYKIIKAVEPPVLIVIGERSTLKRILICSGGAKYIERAVSFAGSIARSVGAAITLFHVVAELPADYSDLIKMEEDVNLLLHSQTGLGQNLRHEKEALEKMGVASEVRLRHGLVISEVVKEIRRGDYDLVVTGSSPESATLRRYIMGNITREIVNRAECPVLVVRGGEEPAGIGQSLKGFFSDITHGFGQSKDAESDTEAKTRQQGNAEKG
ncbi:MAG TPA: universal stress protein [Blastocatellia bacterium]|nr:universal stress protein [Blastocatellia bacterium]